MQFSIFLKTLLELDVSWCILLYDIHFILACACAPFLRESSHIAIEKEEKSKHHTLSKITFFRCTVWLNYGYTVLKLCVDT
jgi:hypothetical protein